MPKSFPACPSTTSAALLKALICADVRIKHSGLLLPVHR